VTYPSFKQIIKKCKKTRQTNNNKKDNKKYYGSRLEKSDSGLPLILEWSAQWNALQIQQLSSMTRFFL
jgi:hypothetical protein